MTLSRDSAPILTEESFGDLPILTDPHLYRASGVRVAFSGRTGGVSVGPYESLNLAGHVGDDPVAVNRNRDVLMTSLDLDHQRHSLVTAEQVHGTRVTRVGMSDRGSGAYVGTGPGPIPGADGLITDGIDVPLLMLYADCVPVVLVSVGPRSTVAVLHSGWRGTLARIAARGVESVASLATCDPSNIRAYVGPHIGSCCYNVDDEIMSHFCNEFDTITAVDGRLNLTHAVVQTLRDAGLEESMIVTADACTRDRTDRYFSYRANPVTGRHGALVTITKV